FDYGIVLPIAAQTDALPQVIHAKEMIFPLRIEHAQHDHALMMAHGIGTNQTFLGVIPLLQLVENRVAEFLPVQRLRLYSFGEDIDAETSKDGILQAFDVPILRVNITRS